MGSSPIASLKEGVAPIVYRLGHDPFKVERRVRFPLALCSLGSCGVGAGWLQDEDGRNADVCSTHVGRRER